MATFLHSEYPHLMRTQMFINGEWVDGVKTTPVYDPSDLSVIAEVAMAGDSQCEAALAAADAASTSVRATPPVNNWPPACGR